MTKKKVTIFTDGSCTLSDNGRGGYGAYLVFEDSTLEIYGGYSKTTNNRMELAAVIHGLKELKTPHEVIIYSDSTYVVDAINKKRLIRWFAEDFKGRPNSDLWKNLIKELGKHEVTFIWIKGHNKGECPGNEKADELAASGSQMEDRVTDVIPAIK